MPDPESRMFWKRSKQAKKASGKSDSDYARDVAEYIRYHKFGPETRSAVYNDRRMEFIKGKDFGLFVRDHEEKVLELFGGEVRCLLHQSASVRWEHRMKCF